MNKAEIISKTLKLVSPVHQSPISEDQDEEVFIVSVLRDRLPDGVDILTCEDFRHLGVECCETCHDYPQYDMSVIDLFNGGKAWVCDTVKWTIYPEQSSEVLQWSKRAPEGKLLREIFGESEK